MTVSRRFGPALAGFLALLSAGSASAQSEGDHGAALAIALTPASTLVTMNPALLGDASRGALSFNSAHKPGWRTYGGSVSVGGFRIQAGKGRFLQGPEKHYFAGVDYARRFFTLPIVSGVGLTVGADASFGWGATELQEGVGEVGQTSGILLPAALRITSGSFELVPYFAPGGFFGRYSVANGSSRDSRGGRRFTEGGGVRFEAFHRIGMEFSVRKTLISDAVPRYGMGMWYTVAPLPPGLTSQVRNLRFEMDNDFYTFWVPPQKRTDDDYTNGVRISFERASAAGPLARLSSNLPFCSEALSAGRCGSATIELGQEIYTPTQDSPFYLVYDRPYAGWLYLSYAGHSSTPVEDRVATIRAGVTGPPSMAQGVQTAFHRLFPWARHPTGWETQLKTEPGLVASYARRYIVASSVLPNRLIQLVPEWNVSAGNVLTGASAAGSVRVGYHLPHPWFLSPDAREPRFSVFAYARQREDLVLHNIFLDGNTFGGRRAVTRIPWVWQQEAGGGVKAGPFVAEYRAVARQREYRVHDVPLSTTGFHAPGVTDAGLTVGQIIQVPASHSYGTLAVTIERAF